MRMILRSIVLACVALLFLPAVAAAGPYSNDGISVSDPTPSPGGSVDVVASGFRPNSSADVFFRSTPVLLASTTADGVGDVKVTVVIPSTASGEHRIEVVGVAPDGSVRAVSTAVSVDTGGNPTSPPNPLPTTGSSTAPTVAIAIAIALVGLVLLLGTRLRRRARSA